MHSTEHESINNSDKNRLLEKPYDSQELFEFLYFNKPRENRTHPADVPTNKSRPDTSTDVIFSKHKGRNRKASCSECYNHNNRELE